MPKYTRKEYTLMIIKKYKEKMDKYLVLFCLFRWFRFTLKPPYTLAHGNLLSAIWDTSHWTSFVKFGLKTA